MALTGHGQWPRAKRGHSTLLPWGMGARRAGDIEGGLSTVQGESWCSNKGFLAGDFKIQSRIPKTYLSVFLRKFVGGELDPTKGINSRDRKTWDPGHNWSNTGTVRPEFLGWWRQGQKSQEDSGAASRNDHQVEGSGRDVYREKGGTGRLPDEIIFLRGEKKKSYWDLEKGVERKISDRYLEDQAKEKCNCERWGRWRAGVEDEDWWKK